MVMMGCPNCGSQESCSLNLTLGVQLNTEYWNNSPASFEQLICLNCGTVYVDRFTLKDIKQVAKEYEERAQV